jgi:hypothetical protein
MYSPFQSSSVEQVQAAPVDQAEPTERESAGAHQNTDSASDAAVRDREPWSVLLLLLVAQFMVIVDITVVNVALPGIGAAGPSGFGQGYADALVAAAVLAGFLVLVSLLVVPEIDADGTARPALHGA